MFRKLRNNLVKLAMPVLVATALLGVGTLAPAATLAAPAAQSQADMESLKKLSGEQFETDFMNMMIEHHQSALDMSKLAPTRANHQEVKDIAQKIIADQTREIGEMTGWLKQWYNVTPKGGMMGAMPGMGMSDMMKLEGLTGDEFDKAFLTMMRMHHMSAVEMAKLVPDRATHAELKTLGQNIISSQTAEISQFEGWLKAWYNIDVMSMGGMSGMGDMAGMGGEMSGGMSSGSGGSLPSAGDGRETSLLLAAMVMLAGTVLMGGVWLRKRALRS